MSLDPQTQSLLARLNAINFSLTRGMTPERVRRREQSLRQLVEIGAVEPVAQVFEREIPSELGMLPLRIYVPAGSGPFPMLVYFHSGGGVMGDLETEDALCRRLTNQSGWLTISVAYRLAPEYKFPAGLEECYSAVCWAAEHATEINGQPDRLAIGGMSAGANLAAVLAHMVRDRSGPPLAMQILVAPITDFRLPDTVSMQTYAEGYLLTRDDILWFTHHCLRSETDRCHPLLSPSLAATCAGLPPALIITAEYDPLRDDGERYGQRLRAEGVPVTISRRPGAIHGFQVEYQVAPVIAEIAAALRTCPTPSFDSGK